MPGNRLRPKAPSSRCCITASLDGAGDSSSAEDFAISAALPSPLFCLTNANHELRNSPKTPRLCRVYATKG